MKNPFSTPTNSGADDVSLHPDLDLLLALRHAGYRETQHEHHRQQSPHRPSSENNPASIRDLRIPGLRCPFRAPLARARLIGPALAEPTPFAATLEPAGAHTFRLESKDGFASVGEPVVFEVTDDGRVTRMKVGANAYATVEAW